MKKILFFLALSISLYSCNKGSTKFYPPVSFEGLITAFESDSVHQYLSGKYSYLTTVEDLNIHRYFPVTLGSFIGELRHNAPESISFTTGDLTVGMKEKVGDAINDITVRVSEADYSKFVDSIASNHIVFNRNASDLSGEQTTTFHYYVTETKYFSVSVKHKDNILSVLLYPVF